MKGTALMAVMLSSVTPALAHRLDEYLQATFLSVEKDRVEGEMFLTPGVAIASEVITAIDTDRNGVASDAEQRAYATQVLGDLSLTLDGDRVTPELRSIEFPKLDEMKEGMGAIHLEFDVALPRSGGKSRKLRFENHHRDRLAVYQVNALMPRSPEIRLGAEYRNHSQSVYALEFIQTSARSPAVSLRAVGMFTACVGGWWLARLWAGKRRRVETAPGLRPAP